ncbi:hypothetical protein [Cryptosporidium parvum Iowa II]|uniref:Uncharacterized protein n=2 Tax=Cryptosporidium parvum TaxID=5807 RepID=Q5CWS0_CRYPI|nr:hypothetical protein [Cryptosporidium parvum Iowa II]QOY41285.1 Uncharacterized protein CPATCC_0015590 [Cryptosporidium parvum]WKS78513.1 hypothetical protein CPCDC_6g3980 [Cryptosporidium sp. 43IA8]EAK90003.1 hypothetical protein cgd6_3980 [Cryptosporidium parvum Iowa II]WRK33005.1 Uncharacterized protein cpbgf_6003980 [Cryptosporidium parvum]CAD98439.1 hypothetical predicted protein, unknown function [Cryptosporidium parvum]|eukprot:QOY41285.1 hypothetical protein CPATCC_002965 [Cryptosporidium parvum]
MVDNLGKPLTRGQRKRRLVLERVKRKQDLTSYLLREKQLENAKNIKKKCYNLNNLKHEIINASEVHKEEASSQEKGKKNKLSRKKIQNIKKSSIEFYKDVLQHPDFNEIGSIKSMLMEKFENNDHGNDQIMDIVKKSNKGKQKVNKSVKVAKSIKKR